MDYVKLEFLSLKNHPELNEKWTQDRIAEDTSIMGLGDLILKDRERVQPKAGRLDLLLQDPESNRRYEVEIQLGATDERHIIRTIEYWDIERKRYPQYDHCAVIVAEDVTGRFLNVISLFNGMIPIIAIQMKATKFGDKVGLLFTKVLDEVAFGLVDEDEEVSAVTDRTYWEDRGTKETVQMADRLLEIVKRSNSALELKYNKFYIGLAENNQPNNFVSFIPRKSGLILHCRVDRSEEVDALIDESDLDKLDYDKRWRQYRIRLKKQDIEKHEDTITELIRRAYETRLGA